MIILQDGTVIKHYGVFELVPPDIYKNKGDSAVSLFDLDALKMVDDATEYLGVKAVINDWHWGGKFEDSGRRSQAKEKILNPKTTGHSQHCVGRAFDVKFVGISADKARQIFIKNKDNPLLRRMMRLEGKVDWVHMDNMPISEWPEWVRPKGRIWVF